MNIPVHQDARNCGLRSQTWRDVTTGHLRSWDSSGPVWTLGTKQWDTLPTLPHLLCFSIHKGERTKALSPPVSTIATSKLPVESETKLQSQAWRHMPMILAGQAKGSRRRMFTTRLACKWELLQNQTNKNRRNKNKWSRWKDLFLPVSESAVQTPHAFLGLRCSLF